MKTKLSSDADFQAWRNKECEDTEYTHALKNMVAPESYPTVLVYFYEYDTCGACFMNYEFVYSIDFD